jgi:Mn-dependent DtxR family transcriptional regulator
MNLPPNQRSVLLALTTDWQTPIQIAAQLPIGDPDTVNQALKNLMSKGFVQVNPVIFGMYRLTSDGTATKADLLGE